VSSTRPDNDCHIRRLTNGFASKGERAIQIDGQQQIGFIAYISPGNENAWTDLIKYDPEKLSVLVVNPLNGPDSSYNQEWGNVISRAKASKKTVIGYVQTGYLGLAEPNEFGDHRTRLGSLESSDWVAQIEEDVDRWFSLYGSDIDGIFFDEGWNLCGLKDDSTTQIADIYAYIDRYVKLRYPGVFTVLNPGTPVPQCYEHTMDTFVTFEGPFDKPDAPVDYANSYTDIKWVPQDIRKLWHIVYEVSEANIVRAVQLAKERNVGLLHITDDLGGTGQNPYDSVPNAAYMNKLLAAVEGGVPLREEKSWPEGAAAETPESLTRVAFDYTSVKLEWFPALNALGYQVYIGNTVNVSVPAEMTEVTIGGLSPGTTYDFSVTTIGGKGEESQHSPSVSATTLELPNGQPIGEYSSTVSDTSTVVRADVYVPYSFTRVYFWDTVNCPAETSESAYPVSKDGTIPPVYVCARYRVEDGKLWHFIGKPPYPPPGAVQWQWEVTAEHVDVKRDGYTYTWNVPIGRSTFDTSKFAVQVEGYGPRTTVFESTPVAPSK
jgi:hypothetical protein